MLISKSVHSSFYKNNFTFLILFKRCLDHNKAASLNFSRYDSPFFQQIVPIIAETIWSISRLNFFSSLNITCFHILLLWMYFFANCNLAFIYFFNTGFLKHFWYLNLPDFATYFLMRLRWHFKINCFTIFEDEVPFFDIVLKIASFTVEENRDGHPDRLFLP